MGRLGKQGRPSTKDDLGKSENGSGWHFPNFRLTFSERRRLGSDALPLELSGHSPATGVSWQ